MFNFTNAPPPEATKHKFQLIRTPKNGKLQAIVTCENLVGTPTHFWGGRTQPCGDLKCDACAAGARIQWHAYLSIWIPQQARHAILECTALASEPLVKYRITHGTLRGALITATRLGPRQNSRVHITAMPSGHSTENLPDPPDLIKCLARIWNVPPNECQLQGHNEGLPDLHVADGQACLRLNDPSIDNVKHILAAGNPNPPQRR